MKQYAVIFFLLCLLTALPSVAQTPQYQFTRIDADQGLSNSQINCIYKDNKGFMWFGTMSGLNRYDGYSFRIFRNDLHDSTSLPDNFIERITDGPDSLLWIYARDGQHIFDPSTNTFRRDPQPLLQQLGIPGNALTNIVKDEQGHLWLIHPTTGLYCYTPGTKPAVHLEAAGNNIAAFAPGASNVNWILHNNGVLEKNGCPHPPHHQPY